jgi:hypothetical protein
VILKVIILLVLFLYIYPLVNCLTPGKRSSLFLETLYVINNVRRMWGLNITTGKMNKTYNTKVGRLCMLPPVERRSHAPMLYFQQNDLILRILCPEDVHLLKDAGPKKNKKKKNAGLQSKT